MHWAWMNWGGEHQLLEMRRGRGKGRVLGQRWARVASG